MARGHPHRRRLSTPTGIEANAHGLARYARICQEGGLVPVVEPEVLMDGGHDIDTCQHVTEATLDAVFAALKSHGGALEGMILKPNMVIAGSDCPSQAGADEIAAKTVASLRRCVPAAMPGITFLSGGQTEVEATVNLNAMNAKFGPNPWKLSFSYGRGIAGQCPESVGWQGGKRSRRARYLVGTCTAQQPGMCRNLRGRGSGLSVSVRRVGNGVLLQQGADRSTVRAQVMAIKSL